MRVYDICTYNGEADLLELRLSMLNEHVSRFYIIEFDKTFSGKPKPPYFLRFLRSRFEKWLPQIRYRLIDESVYFLPKYTALADNSPNVPKGGAEHWRREFCQKESIKEALVELRDRDLCFVGDVDEIWNPAYMHFFRKAAPQKIKLAVYTYWLNNRSSEEFWGTTVLKYRDIKDGCLNHLRTVSPKTAGTLGWHFTSMGGVREVARKLSDSYTRESYWTEAVERSLVDNFDNRRDFLGRDFTYCTDESEWPEYLKENRYNFARLLPRHER